MPNSELVNITNCHENCERLFEVERERDELRAERDTWAIAAELLTDSQYQAIRFGTLLSIGEPLEVIMLEELAAAFSLAEAYGEDWRQELER
jgi:hypothetical protein